MSKLDVELMKRLYEFGALAVYRVSYFCESTFAVECLPYTFSEATAQKQVAEFGKSGGRAYIESILVKFDGAFAEADEISPHLVPYTPTGKT